MITIFHGTDPASSRKAFIDAKKQVDEIVTLDGTKVDLMALRQAVEGGGLFGSEQTIILEELLSKRKASKELDSVLSYLSAHQDSDMLLWESKELTPKQLGNFPKAKALKFTLPSVLFSFLDSLRPGNTREMLTLFHEVLVTQEPEMVFFMMIRQVRILLVLRDVGSVSIDEVARLAPWQKGKLQKQAQAFDSEKLRSLFHDLYELEKSMKTGKLVIPLENALDILILSL